MTTSTTPPRLFKPLIVTALLLATAGGAWAASLSLAPGASGTGEDRFLDGRFEVFRSQGLGGGDTGFDTASRTIPEYRFAFEFDLASLPAGAVIQSASLSLRNANFNRAGQTLLSGYAGDGTIDLGRDMRGGSELLRFTPSDSTTQLYDVTSFVQSVVGPGQSWVGFNLR